MAAYDDVAIYLVHKEVHAVMLKSYSASKHSWDTYRDGINLLISYQ